MSTPPPKITFPCQYPIRIVGLAATDFTEFVIKTVKNHAPDFNEKITSKWSKNKKYQSICLTINAQGEAQLKAIFNDLKASGRVQFVI